MKKTYPNVYEARSLLEALSQAENYKKHRERLKEIKAKKRSVNTSLGGSSILSSEQFIASGKKPRNSFQKAQRDLEIYVENHHLVRKITDIHRRAKPTLYSMNEYKEHESSFNSRPWKTRQENIYYNNQKMLQRILFPYFVDSGRKCRLPSVSKERQDAEYVQNKRYLEQIRKPNTLRKIDLLMKKREQESQLRKASKVLKFPYSSSRMNKMNHSNVIEYGVATSEEKEKGETLPEVKHKPQFMVEKLDEEPKKPFAEDLEVKNLEEEIAENYIEDFD